MIITATTKTPSRRLGGGGGSTPVAKRSPWRFSANRSGSGRSRCAQSRKPVWRTPRRPRRAGPPSAWRKRLCTWWRSRRTSAPSGPWARRPCGGTWGPRGVCTPWPTRSRTSWPVRWSRACRSPVDRRERDGLRPEVRRWPRVDMTDSESVPADGFESDFGFPFRFQPVKKKFQSVYVHRRFPTFFIPRPSPLR